MRADLDSVLLSVEFAIRAAARAFDPFGIGFVPLDRFAQAGLPGFARTPAELRLNQRRVDCITAIVARASFDVLDQRLRFPKLIENGSGYVDVALFISRADIIG